MSDLKVFVLAMYPARMREPAMEKLEDFLSDYYPYGYWMPKSFEEAINVLNDNEIKEWLGLAF